MRTFRKTFVLRDKGVNTVPLNPGMARSPVHGPLQFTNDIFDAFLDLCLFQYILRLKLFAGLCRYFNVVGYDLPALGPGEFGMMPNLPYFRRHSIERDSIRILCIILPLASFIKNRRGNVTNHLPLFSTLLTQYNIGNRYKLPNP